MRKFQRMLRSLHRLARTAEALEKAKLRIEAELAADREKLAERQERRALAAGAWLLSSERTWFESPEQRADFAAWMIEVRCRAPDVKLFAPDADDDLLTPARVSKLAEEVGAADLLKEILVSEPGSALPGRNVRGR